MRRRVDPATLRAAWWALGALRDARRQLEAGLLTDVVVPTPPALPAHAARGVRGLLRLAPATCLERAVVLQRWHLSQGTKVDVVIGVDRAGGRFRAHAWLAQDRTAVSGGFQEIARLPAP
jgi:hypothetical protein